MSYISYLLAAHSEKSGVYKVKQGSIPKPALLCRDYQFLKLNRKEIKPIIIIDELQALDHIYVNGQRELITELFNFFVAMTKESHLAHVIISSSDGYFVDTVYKDNWSRK